MLDKLLSNPMHKYIAIAILLLISVYISGQCLNYKNYVIEEPTRNKRNIIDNDNYDDYM